MSRVLWFGLGIVFGIAVLLVGGYFFVRGGGVPMGTAAEPLPLERTVARIALRASYGPSATRKNPLPVSEQNMLDGAMTYADNCAVCHGVPGKPRTALAKGMFPDPPGLFEAKEMVTDDPEGTILLEGDQRHPAVRDAGVPEDALRERALAGDDAVQTRGPPFAGRPRRVGAMTSIGRAQPDNRAVSGDAIRLSCRPFSSKFPLL